MAKLTEKEIERAKALIKDWYYIKDISRMMWVSETYLYHHWVRRWW